MAQMQTDPRRIFRTALLDDAMQISDDGGNSDTIRLQFVDERGGYEWTYRRYLDGWQVRVTLAIEGRDVWTGIRVSGPKADAELSRLARIFWDEALHAAYRQRSTEHDAAQAQRSRELFDRLEGLGI